MTVKALLDAIEDAKITADLVVSDRGRLQPVTEIRASENVVMLICRPRPNWGIIEDCPPAGSMTLKQTQDALKASKRKRKDKDEAR